MCVLSIQAVAFDPEKDYITGVKPKHQKGALVWIYRKRIPAWVEAKVADTRNVLSEGIYLIDLGGGVRVEGYEQILSVREECTEQKPDDRPDEATTAKVMCMCAHV